MDLVAANKSPIKIEGAALLRISGILPHGRIVSCASMVYISSQAKGFFLSREVMIDLGIISNQFPTIGENVCNNPESSGSLHSVNAKQPTPL